MSELDLVAIHEAAHCVIATVVGVPVGKVTVEETEDTLGQCELSVDPTDSGETRAYCLAVLAGGFAEARARGVKWDVFQHSADPSHGEDGDLELFEHYLSVYARLTGVSAKRAEARIFQECEQLVSAHWSEITRLARILAQAETVLYPRYGANPVMPLERACQTQSQ